MQPGWETERREKYILAGVRELGLLTKGDISSGSRKMDRLFLGQEERKCPRLRKLPRRVKTHSIFRKVKSVASPGP